jgi:hypothetical protein
MGPRAIGVRCLTSEEHLIARNSNETHHVGLAHHHPARHKPKPKKKKYVARMNIFLFFPL